MQILSYSQSLMILLFSSIFCQVNAFPRDLVVYTYFTSHSSSFSSKRIFHVFVYTNLF